MIRHALTVLVTIGLLTPVLAQETQSPQRFIRLFNPGMHLGLHGSGTTESIRIYIYSDADFAVHADARVLTLDELVSKYDTVAKARDDKLKQWTDSGETDEPELRANVERSVLLCEVVHVGEDYLIIKYADKSDNRAAFPIARVNSVYWAGPLRLSATKKTSDK